MKAMTTRAAAMLILACPLLLLGGCSKEKKGGGKASGSGAAGVGGVGGVKKGTPGVGKGKGKTAGGGTQASAASANADIELDPKAPADPARQPKAPETLPAEVAVRTIVVKYISANAPGDAKRSKKAAAERAKLVVKRARQKDVDFLALAKRVSDAPPSERERVFKVGPHSKLPFGKAAMGLQKGQVSDVIPSREGFYIAMRVEPQELSTAHILFIYRGAAGAPVAFKRTKKDALVRANKVLKKALKGRSFALLAATYSDSPSKIRGGVIAPLTLERVKNPKVYQPGFIAYFNAAKGTEPGKVHDNVVETPYGFHVIRRLKLQKILAQHILIAYKGSGSKARADRPKHEARSLAGKLRMKILRGADFSSLARTHSEDAESAQRGGMLRPVARGETVPRFEQFAFALKPGKVSQVVESRLGFHVIKRLR